ncbi:hypothetical protein BGZ80_002478 [Entomortierella chlamydospora]|uniref:Uncharacterized protein n=1 Tax=Entomortierella chlamydospora TaxID=101097 RepID=A0A9P6MQE9_9FUNG|nr:hypothetical protein BGZ80_002478 [Entomortierella chlamydospora]
MIDDLKMSMDQQVAGFEKKMAEQEEIAAENKDFRIQVGILIGEQDSGTDKEHKGEEGRNEERRLVHGGLWQSILSSSCNSPKKDRHATKAPRVPAIELMSYTDWELNTVLMLMNSYLDFNVV